MKSCLLIKTLLLLFTGCLVASTSGIKLPDKLSGEWFLSDEVLVFDGQNLYGHINGGAEIFLEFGFDQLFISTYRNRKNQIDVEIYRMKNESAAQGIYLLKNDRGKEEDRIIAQNTTHPYQIMMTRGQYFIQINNFSGQTDNVQILIELANMISQQIDESDIQSIFKDLPQANRIEGSERLFCGPYSLQTIYTFGEGDILQLHSKIYGIAADYQDSSAESYTHLIINYPAIAYAQAAFQHVRDHLDPYLSIVEQKSRHLIFSDYQNNYGLIEIDRETISIKIHLVTIPEL